MGIRVQQQQKQRALPTETQLKTTESFEALANKTDSSQITYLSKQKASVISNKHSHVDRRIRGSQDSN